MWAPRKNGTYNIEDGYRIIQQPDSTKMPCCAFSFCWNQFALPKAGCFSWIALKKRALTSDHLTKFHIAQPYNWPLCDQEIEDVDHLFLNCPFVQQCWKFFLGKLQYLTPLPNKLWDLFQAWLVLHSTSLFSSFCKSILAIVVWALWWECNKRIFYKNSSSIESVLTGIEKSISEVVNSNQTRTKCNPVLSLWGSAIIQECKGIHVPIRCRQQAQTNSSQSRDSIYWLPPKCGIAKINFDGSS